LPEDALRINVLATGPTTVKAVRPASFSVSTTAKYFLEHQDAPAETCETGFPAAKGAAGCPGDLAPSTHTYRLFTLLKSGAWKERRGEARLYLRSGSGQQPVAAFPVLALARKGCRARAARMAR
jgi:hypothetical protein